MRQSHANPFLEPGDLRPDDGRSPVRSEPPSRREPVAVAPADENPAAAEAVRALEDGRAFAVVIEADADASTHTVADVARTLAARGVSVTTVGNVTPWPLTLDKLVAQIGGEPGSDPEQVLHGRFKEPGRAVLAIDQADTLDDRAMRFVADLSKASRASGSKLQLVFAGRDSLLGKLSTHGFAAPRPVASRILGAGRIGAAATVACVVVLAIVVFSLAGRGARDLREGPPAVTAASQPAAASTAPAAATTPDQTAAMQPAADGALMAYSAGAMVPAPAAAPPSAPEPAAVAALAPEAAPLMQPSAAAHDELAPLAPSEVVREATLRHDFSVFLDRSGVQTAKLTPVQRDQLFKDYLVWRLRPEAPGAAPGAASPAVR